MLPVYKTIKAHVYKDNSINEREIAVGAEYSFTIKINNNPFVTIACSGSDLEELTAGLLISEGIIFNYNEITNIDVDYKNFQVNVQTIESDEVIERMFKIHSIASGCGQGKITDMEIVKNKIKNLPDIDAKIVISSLKKLLASTKLHELTRGVHSAALYSIDGNEIVFFDEIGRHNAVDKIIGHCFSKKIDLQNKMIISTGRLSSEIVLKTFNAGIPVLVSKAAPTTLSVELARKHNIILLCKVNGKGFTIFNGPEHILLDRI
jgi:FdhD protein